MTFLALGITFSPLLGFLLGAFGLRLGDRFAQLLTCGFMALATMCAWGALYMVALEGNALSLELLSFIHMDNFRADWGIELNTLTTVMMMVVTTVSLMVHIYSIGYMSHDTSITRFMIYLSLFTFMMLMLVSAPNLIQLFFGWEGVGLASYLLIGFWHKKPSANAAAIKAFVVNRVGDLGLVLGIAAIFYVFRTVDIGQIIEMAPMKTLIQFHAFGADWQALEVIAVLLFIGAMGKSAQIGLHVWLPDAMEGPTPVSALIHAATMVTAGVFLVARLSPLYELAPFARQLITCIGAITAVFAGTIALTQNDIKRVIAYSTCSQLGYMFFAAGLSAYSVSIFHLVTHAFFKALLFLGAGSVIHALSDEQDMRHMGGIWRAVFVTYVLMLIGSFALMGFPPLAGYYSKDAILISSWLAPHWTASFAFVMGLLAAFLTAFYSGRLLWMTFHGKPRASEHVMSHLHESSPAMLWPLAFLALGAVLAGYVGQYFFMDSSFWGGSIVTLAHEEPEVPFLIHYAPLIAGVLGFAGSYGAYMIHPTLPAQAVTQLPRTYAFLSQKWYFDELYDKTIVAPLRRLGDFFWISGDQRTIDGLGPDGVSAGIKQMARRLSSFTTGLITQYAYLMAIGVACLLLWALWRP